MRASQSPMMAEPPLAESVMNHDRTRNNFLGLKGGCAFLRRPISVVPAMESILKSIAWKSLIVVFTIVLLFGSPIQSLLSAKEADSIFEIIYIVALIVFLVDMIFNMIVDSNYLGLDFFRRNRVQPFDQAKFCPYGIGSFRMWCDVVSTGALLYDISCFNPLQNRAQLVELKLDEFGLPVCISRGLS